MSQYDIDYMNDRRKGHHTAPITQFFGTERSLLDDRSASGDVPLAGERFEDIFELTKKYDTKHRINWRAFTITFKDNMREQYTEKELTSLVYLGLRALPILHFIMCPDVDTSGKFHMHGVIRTQQKHLPTIKRLVERWFGYNKIKSIDNTPYWYAYMRKEKGFQTTKMERNGIEPLDEAIYEDDEFLSLTISF